MSRLTVLSFGAGQDSTALLYKYIYDEEFARKYVGQDFVVVMADTGNEHEETNRHRREIQRLCKEHGISFWFLTGNMGFTSPSWSKGLVHFYEVTDAIGSKAFPKTCTDKLKITPIYNWLEEYIFNTYTSIDVVGRKRAIKQFAEKHGKIDVILGIAAGEESRAGTNEESPSVWMRLAVNKVYPLIELKMDRQACQDYIKEVGHTVPLPSNCILCPFMGHQELLYLYREMFDWYFRWTVLENNKLAANAYKGDITKAVNKKTGKIVDNLGVWGKKTLPEVLKIAEEKFGHMTTEELYEYKMSHGHCVKSKY